MSLFSLSKIYGVHKHKVSSSFILKIQYDSKAEPEISKGTYNELKNDLEVLKESKNLKKKSLIKEFHYFLLQIKYENTNKLCLLKKEDPPVGDYHFIHMLSVRNRNWEK